MTTSTVAAPRARTMRWRTTLVAWLVAAVSVLLASSVLAVRGTAVVSGAVSLHRVGFGWPVPWLFQDQQTLEPPYPFRTTFLSPWENPTGVHLAALAWDVLVVFVPLLLIWLAASRIRRGGGEH